jgi:hypothetical protein
MVPPRFDFVETDFQRAKALCEAPGIQPHDAAFAQLTDGVGAGRKDKGGGPFPVAVVDGEKVELSAAAANEPMQPIWRAAVVDGDRRNRLDG